MGLRDAVLDRDRARRVGPGARDGTRRAYVTQATLFAIPFDLNTLTTRGTAVPVVDDVAYDSVVGVGQFDVSRTGTLVYRRAIAGAAALRTLQWVDIEGKKEPLRARPATCQDLNLSP